MTRKDFELIARAIRATRNLRTETDPETTEQVLRDVSHQLAAHLQETNVMFDRARFLNACGV